MLNESSARALLHQLADRYPVPLLRGGGMFDEVVDFREAFVRVAAEDEAVFAEGEPGALQLRCRLTVPALLLERIAGATACVFGRHLHGREPANDGLALFVVVKHVDDEDGELT